MVNGENTSGFLIMIAAFRSEFNQNKIHIGRGLTLIEAIVRSVEYELSDEEMKNIIYMYGPDDLDGLNDWYESRGIYLSEAEIIEQPEIDKIKRIK